MGHGHSHSHTHRHPHDHVHGDPHDAHAPGAAHGHGAYRFGVVVNSVLVVVEAGAGFVLGSMALLADAGHNAGDVLGLLLAWGAARLALRAPTKRHTFGYARSTILAAMLNAGLLLFACGALALESLRRLGSPSPVPGGWVMLFAGLAFAVNLASALRFRHAARHDLNARGAWLHLAWDAGLSLAVVATGALVLVTGWRWLDPLVGLALALAILWSAMGLLRESLSLSLDAVPGHLELAAIEASLRALSGVRAIHDLHVWSLSTSAVALTAHVEHDGTQAPDALLASAHAVLAERFGIRHTTLQLEGEGCGRACADAARG